MNISFILPSRNNLKYLKWSYAAIRKNQGTHNVQICVADDASTDGTNVWLEETAKTDPELSFMINQTGHRLGHTILYDILVNSFAKHDLCMIYHADMYLCPGALDALEKYMYTRVEVKTCFNDPNGIDVIDKYRSEGWLFFSGSHVETDGKNYGLRFKIEPNYKTITSLTRIEPPLHPAGYEKIILDCGVEPEQFDELKLLQQLAPLKDVTTEGIFAPWAFFKQDFQEIGGHDPLYAPQSKEDSDIFNRFQLNGVKFIQTWEGFVYHMTCRGSRYNPTLTTPGTDSDEWKIQNIKSARNFIRKWGHFVQHDSYMKPIVPHKYDIGIVIEGCTIEILRGLEPWCSDIYVDLPLADIHDYYVSEQDNTQLKYIENKIHHYPTVTPDNDVVVTIARGMLSTSDAQYIQMLPDILADSGEVGQTMGIGNLKITINKLQTYENELIVCKN